MFDAEGPPNGIGAIADAVSFDQFPRHCREHVIVFIDALESFTGKLALHGKSHEELLAHDTQTGRQNRT